MRSAFSRFSGAVVLTCLCSSGLAGQELIHVQRTGVVTDGYGEPFEKPVRVRQIGCGTDRTDAEGDYLFDCMALMGEVDKVVLTKPAGKDADSEVIEPKAVKRVAYVEMVGEDVARNFTLIPKPLHRAFNHVFRGGDGRFGSARPAQPFRIELSNREWECHPGPGNCQVLKSKGKIPGYLRRDFKPLIRANFPGEWLAAVNVVAHPSGMEIHPGGFDPEEGVVRIGLLIGPSPYWFGGINTSRLKAAPNGGGFLLSSGILLNEEQLAQGNPESVLGTLLHEVAHSFGEYHPEGYSAVPVPSIMCKSLCANSEQAWMEVALSPFDKEGIALNLDRTASVKPDRDLHPDWLREEDRCPPFTTCLPEQAASSSLRIDVHICTEEGGSSIREAIATPN